MDSIDMLASNNQRLDLNNNYSSSNALSTQAQ